jgi:hypothetical protein
MEHVATSIADYGPEDIEYRFHRLYSIDLDSAKQSLRMLRRYRRDDVRYCILRDAVIIYSRPFSGNQGPKGRGHKLALSFVPRHHRALHRELIELRSGLLAHTDFTVHEPRVAKWAGSRAPVYAMTFRRPSYEKFFARLQDIEDLFSTVEANLHADIRNFESAP